MRKLISTIIASVVMLMSFSQDLDYARKMVQKLASEDFAGRGYVKRGDWKAAVFIGKQFYVNDLKNFESAYFQDYTIPMNTFPGKISVSIDGSELIPDVDYVISSSAPSVNKSFSLVDLRSMGSNTDSILSQLDVNNGDKLFLINEKNTRDVYGRTVKNAAAVAILTEKTPYWHVSNGGIVEETVWMKIHEDRIPENAQTLDVKVKNRYYQNYQTQNVIGWVEGSRYPDKYFVITAHYDHLGMMGNETYYPGANDNASGTAMLLDLARHYSMEENRPEYSVVFIAFSGEEAGLHGSTYFANNPLFPLKDIELLVNLDMVGSGSEGITVVNGTLYDDLMKQMQEINDKDKFLVEIVPRSESCNSDHCPFYEKGVKSIFIYTRGPELQKYHTTDDAPDNFPFTAYDGLFGLITSIIDK